MYGIVGTDPIKSKGKLENEAVHPGILYRAKAQERAPTTGTRSCAF
jgi:hypothetical protein